MRGKSLLYLLIGAVTLLNMSSVSAAVLSEEIELGGITLGMPQEVVQRTYGNPIEINTTNVSLPNFYVTIRPGEPTIAANGQVTTRVTITISDKQGTIQLLGGTVGSVVVTGSISTSIGTYEFTTSTVDKSGVTLGENNHTESFDVDLVSSANLPEGTTISLANVTCSISGKALGQSGSYIVQNGVATTGSGQIKLDSNGS
jgi:hypothetical protein